MSHEYAPMPAEHAGTVLVASHRRSGTHLTLDSLVNNFPAFRAGFGNLDRSTASDGARGYRLFKTHSHGNLIRFAESRGQVVPHDARIIYVHRDGRDVMVSLYHYMCGFDERIREVHFDDFIKMTNEYDSETYDGNFNRVTYWRFHVESWINHADHPVLFISFQDWINEYERTIEKVAEFINAKRVDDHVVDLRRQAKPSLASRAKNAVSRRLFGRSKESSIGFRSGKIGAWRELFTNSSLSYFESQAAGLEKLVAERLSR